MENTIEICGQPFDRNIEDFGFEWPFEEIVPMSELEKLQWFPNLRTASFGNTNLDDLGLQYVCKCTNIDNLNLQETFITNEGIQHLLALKQLSYLRLKENEQLNKGCVKHLNQLKQLIDLQLHETGICEEGIQAIDLPNLRFLMVNSVHQDILRDLSRRLPQCNILIKGSMEWLNGKILWQR